jgi:hypothetical protein
MYADLLTYLKTQSSVTSIVGSSTLARIYPDAVKQGASLPCVVYRKIGGGPTTGICGRLGISKDMFEVISIAATRAAADALDAAIYAVLQGGNKTMGSTAVTEVYVGESDRSCGVDGTQEGSDQYDYWARTIYSIWYADGT